MKEVSNHPLRRSTTPLDSGSRGGNNTSLVARVPMNEATPSARRWPRPMPGSLSQINRRGTRPSCWISSHDPNSRSSVFRVGIIRPVTNRECAAVITRTGSNLAVPSSSGILRGGNHKSHCAASPGAQMIRSDGSIGRCSGRSRLTLSLNHRIEPAHPTRSASTVAGMSGVCSSSARTRGSNTVNDVGPGHALIARRRVRVHRLDDRGPRDAQPLRDPCLRHTLRSQPSDQRPVLQSDHSPIVECSLFTAESVQFSSAADSPRRPRAGT